MPCGNSPFFWQLFWQIGNAPNGLLLSAGTDVETAGSYAGFDLHAELALMVQAGLTPMQALQSATRTAAEFLRLADVGTIAPGKVADLVLLDADPLERIENTQKIFAVLLHGKFSDRVALDELLRAAESQSSPNRLPRNPDDDQKSETVLTRPVSGIATVEKMRRHSGAKTTNTT